ncbi:amidohydrolase family protein, partial [Kozakia baliensis]
MEHEKNIDILIKGCDIVTFDKDNTVLRDGYIAIKENKILCMGSKKEFPTKFIAKETIEASGMIAMPGLVDGHYHTGQQLLRGSLAAIHRKHLSKSPHWKNYYIPFETG